MTGRPLDITGRAFGKLIAISVANGVSKRSWICECSCGRRVVVPTFQLTSGCKTKCGECDFEEMIGKRYGKLVVQEILYVPHRTKATCLCDCGKTKDIFVARLKNGRTKSCGCSQYTTRERGGTSMRARINRKFDSYLRSSCIKGQVFQLSKEEASSLFLSECFYCGAKPNPLNGIDRAINNIGYTQDNVVSCCSDCNYMKSNTDIAQFLDRIYAICEHTKQHGMRATTPP